MLNVSIINDIICQESMKVFVGLGNPGTKYKDTRHNAGFLAVDKFAELARVEIDKKDFKGLFTSFNFDGERIFLFKPQTFMNLSGQAVVQIMNFFKVDIEDLYIIYDDMDLSPGNIRLKEDGSSGGQKGMQNIVELLGTTMIKRIRVGIGKPLYDGVDHVLTVPTGEEKEAFLEGVEKASNAIKDLLKHDFSEVMKKYNQKEKQEPLSD